MLLPGDEEDEEPIVDGVIPSASESDPLGEYATRPLPELDGEDPEGDCPGWEAVAEDGVPLDVDWPGEEARSEAPPDVDWPDGELDEDTDEGV